MTNIEQKIPTILKPTFGLIALVLLANLFWYFGGALIFGGIGKGYIYSSIDGSFALDVVPSKGDDEFYILRQVEEWKRQGGCKTDDCTVYRRFKRHWWMFWRWREYIFEKWWSEFPYLAPPLERKDLLGQRKKPRIAQ